ncbi:hypothetical protein [Capnocytophaga sp.]|uniref:hypothetical protein n=1 Tax=Capnocytophaga sp. TaxID=44737 RepID=UPI0026DDC934|nr:hypothetical protein [Capnocytophaga sp.]MDO5106404.1 hypothetical protein [Capnocytophaga sp.]
MKRILVLFFSLITFSVSGQSKLKGAKENLTEKQQSSEIISRESESRTTYEPSYSFSDSFLGLFTGLIFEITVGLAYYIAVESPPERNSPMYQSTLNPYPFASGAKGDYQYANWNNFTLWRLDVSNYYFSERATLFMNDLNVKLRLGSRFAINAQYAHFWEKLLAAKNENLDLISLTGQYYRIRTPYVSMYWGLGASYIANDVNQFGLATEVGNEIFLKPFSIQTDFKYSFFDKSDILVFGIGGKYHFRNFNVGAKYQYINLAGYRASGISVGAGVSF